SLLAGSQASGEVLVARPEWLDGLMDVELLETSRRKEGLERDVDRFLADWETSHDYQLAYTKVRLFKQEQMLRVAARDLARLGEAPQITREISDLADVCLNATLRLCRGQLTERFGSPFHQDANGRWQATEFSVIGLGKLGGQELNYSSDVDVVMTYTE